MDSKGAALRRFFQIHKFMWGTLNLDRQGARLPLIWRIHNLVCPVWRSGLYSRFDFVEPGCRAVIRAMEENRD